MHRIAQQNVVVKIKSAGGGVCYRLNKKQLAQKYELLIQIVKF